MQLQKGVPDIPQRISSTISCFVFHIREGTFFCVTHQIYPREYGSTGLGLGLAILKVRQEVKKLLFLNIFLTAESINPLPSFSGLPWGYLLVLTKLQWSTLGHLLILHQASVVNPGTSTSPLPSFSGQPWDIY